MYRAGLGVSATKLQAVTAALTVCVVACAYLAASSLLDDRTPRERGMLVALTPIAERPPDHIGVVALGTSLTHSALLSHEALSEALSEATDRSVVAANLSIPGAGIESYERVLDDIWQVNPNVLVVELDLFVFPQLFDIDRSLRTRVTRWIEGVAPRTYRALGCAEDQTESRLAGTVRWLARLNVGSDETERMRTFLEVATSNIETVILLAPPRPKEVTDAAMGRDLEIRAELLAVAADLDVVPPVDFEPPPLEDFCDFSHLSETGGERYLTQWGPSLRPLLASP